LLTQLAAIIQIDSNGQEEKRIITLALDRAHVTTTPSSGLIVNAARSFSSIFIEPARLHPEIREVVIDDLIANDRDVMEGALRTVIEQAERVLSDLLELHDERATLTEDQFEQNNLQAQYVNTYAWIDPQKSLNMFLKECLERATISFKYVELYLSLLTETRLERIFPDITKDTYQHLLKDITRPTFLRFLKTFPLSRVESQLKTLFEVVRINLELTVGGSTKESAEALIKQGKVTQQLNRLLELIFNNDHSPEAIYEVTGLAEAYISFAQILNNRERFEEEFNALKTAVNLYEKLSLASSNRKLNYLHRRLAKTAVILEDTSAAQAYAKKALELLPENKLTIQLNEQLPDLIQSQASRLNAKAFNLLRQSSTVDAEVITKIEEAIELDPENVEIYNRAIRAYRRNRQYAEALRASHRLIELHPLHISGLTGRGEVFYELGYFSEAVQTFIDALNIAAQKGNEEALNIYTNLGRCCVMQGKYEDAIIYFDKRINGGLEKLQYLQGRPSLTASDRKFNEKQRNYLKHVYNRKAFALLKLRYVAKAQKLFEEALSIDSNYHESWIGLSLIEMAQNKEHLWQGVRACRENIKINPSKISNYYHQAILHLLINTFSTKEHLNNFRKALSETREAFGFVHEAIFLLNLIRQHVKAKHVDANFINEIVSMLEAHLKSTAGISKDFPHTIGELVDIEPHVRKPSRDQVFISYSHKDKEWLEKLQIMLKPLTRSRKISVWADTGINAGKIWRNEIRKALDSAKVAVLLVSPNFLASDFIAEYELPPLLNAATNEGLTVLWIPISHCLYDSTAIGDYQATTDPSNPLNSLSPTELNRVLTNICREIEENAENT
jgi:tetratricopeptide (TPR) repeat protein